MNSFDSFTIPPSGTHLSFESDLEWRRSLLTLPTILCSIRWWMGDLLTEAPDHEAFLAALATEPRFEAREITRIMAVVEVFPPGRRRPGLSWDAHAACLPLTDGRADKVLAEAEANGWSADEVKQVVVKMRRNPGKRDSK